MYQRMVRYVMELNPDHEVYVFGTGQECLENLQLHPAIISLDYTLPDMKGEEVLRKIKSFNEHIAVIILSGQGDISTAVHLLKEGAYDYITKEGEVKERLRKAVENIKERKELQKELETLRQEVSAQYDFQKTLIGNSRAMHRVFRLLEKAVHTNITVSVYGETGTGKEMVAKAIHYNSLRRDGPFVAVNMGAIPSELLESELFGYEKGAFTGANARKKGQFELADKGTLFLDEIAEIDLTLQAKLLRALQEREVVRLGSEKPVKFDARIIIATHKDLAEEVRQGNFREDLYYRLLGLSVQLPPLRDRENDIIILAQHFLDNFSKHNQLGQLSLSKEAKQKLLNYGFPGNVRELKAVIELASVMALNGVVGAEDIQFQSLRREAEFLTQEMTLDEYKRQIIHHYLEKYDRDVLLVARKLNIGKSTIYRMLQNENSSSRIREALS